MAGLKNKLTDKLVEKVGVQRTPGANPEMYKSDDYSAHLKGDNSVHKKDSTQETLGQKTPDFAEQETNTQQGGDPAAESAMGFKAT